MVVEYVRMRGLDAVEIELVKEKVGAAYPKLLRDIKDAKLIVDVHTFHKRGERKKFSVHLRVDGPSLRLTAEEADWSLSRALQKVIGNLQQEVRHVFKKEVTPRRKKMFQWG